MIYWSELTGLVFSVGFIAGVLGNLTASAITLLPAVVHLSRKMNRHHREATANALRSPPEGR